jgi:hypothetical protein
MNSKIMCMNAYTVNTPKSEPEPEYLEDEQLFSCGVLKTPRPFCNSLRPKDDVTVVYTCKKEDYDRDDRHIMCDVRESLYCLNEPFEVFPRFVSRNYITKGDIVDAMRVHLRTRRDHRFIERLNYEDGKVSFFIGS